VNAWLVRRAGVALLLGAVIGSSARADTVADRLAALKQALQAVRETKASNPDRDAGPELTPVKTAFRRWVEAQLPPPSKPGADPNTIVTPDSASLSALARQLNDALDKAQLTCGDVESASYRCKGRDWPTDNFASERGHVGNVQLGLLDYGRYLLVVTGVGVFCGEDESAYLYKPEGNGWRLVFANEQDDYRKGVYAVQNFTEISVSPWAGEGQPDTPPLVATLGYGPWCSSTWSSLYTRLWRMSGATTSPKPLIDRADGLWWGDDDFGSAQLTANDLLVQRVDSSIDSGIHHRMHIRHYHIDGDNRVERIDPVALRPLDFVDEWLTTKWAEAESWLDPRANRAAARAIHGAFSPDHEFYIFDGTKRCSGDQSLRQVTLDHEPNGSNDHTPPKSLYFRVRWTAPYMFRLVGVSNKPFNDCIVPDPDSDNEATLFPHTQWHPGSGM
jgi:hypothetical protein